MLQQLFDRLDHERRLCVHWLRRAHQHFDSVFHGRDLLRARAALRNLVHDAHARHLCDAKAARVVLCRALEEVEDRGDVAEPCDAVGKRAAHLEHETGGFTFIIYEGGGKSKSLAGFAHNVTVNKLTLSRETRPEVSVAMSAARLGVPPPSVLFTM